MGRPKKTTDCPRIWGYARLSGGEGLETARYGIPSVEMQRERIEAKAAEIANQEANVTLAYCFEEASKSASKTPYHERPEFAKLLTVLRPGDHLIVWRLDRIDQSPFRMIECVKRLVDQGVIIHSLEEKGGVALNLDTLQGRIMLMMWTMLTDMLKAQCSGTLKSGVAWSKSHGLPYSGHVPRGKKRIYLPPLKGQSERRPHDLWDEGEMAQIREIKWRVDNGETLYAVAKDYFLRGEIDAKGKPWVIRRKKGPKIPGTSRRQKKGNLILGRIQRAYQWYSDILAQGKDMGQPDVHM